MKKKIEASSGARDARKHGMTEIYFDLVYPPTDVQEQNKLAQSLLQWAYLSDSVKIEDFPISKRMNPYQFKKLAQKNEYFKECLELASYIIGGRLQDGAHQKRLDKDISLKLLPLYNREYKEWILEQKMAQLAPERQAPQVIYLNPVENSPLVPKRVDDDKSRDTDPLEQVQTAMVPAADHGCIGEQGL